MARFLAAGPPAPTPAELLAEAFRWGEWRTVTKTATVCLHGNLYEVDPALAGARGRAGVRPVRPDRHHRARTTAGPPGRRCRSRSGATCTPRPPPTPHPPATPTGIDYLRLVEDRQTRSLGERLHYAQLTDPAQPDPPAGRVDRGDAEDAATRPPVNHRRTMTG